MSCTINKTPIEDILKAGYAQSEEEALEFLLGLGVETGRDIRYIDGYSTAEATFKLVGNVFMLKKICTKVQTAADNDRLNKKDESVVRSLKDVATYLQKIDKLETDFQDRIVANRQIQAGTTNVVQLRPQLDKGLKLRDCTDKVPTLEHFRKNGFTDREDVLEFLVGVGVQPVEGVRYINGITARDTLRKIIGALNQMKKECVTALRDIELAPSHLCPKEVNEMHNHIHSFLHGLRLEEEAYFKRIAPHKKVAYGGNVVPLKR